MTMQVEKTAAPVTAGVDHESVLIVDFGSQYNQLIARRVRELGVFSELVSPSIDRETALKKQPLGFILSGGPDSVYDEGARTIPPWILESGLPVLGICYGMQALAQALGGKVEAARTREYGCARFEGADGGLLKGLSASEQCWMSHGDHVVAPPPGFETLARSGETIAVIGDARRNIYALQFHPEVEHTPCGAQILRNFLEICGFHFDWTPRAFLEETTEELRRILGGERVLCALSGGVDSTVAAALVHRAIGDRLLCIFVDNGLLRKGEREWVSEKLTAMGLPLRVVDASERFLALLEGIDDPERKRKIIGETFIRVFEEEADRAVHDTPGGYSFLLQGTLYPDVVESGSGGGTLADLIKTHHNVGGLPEDHKFRLLEPFRRLFKDEVRRLGREMGMPAEMLERQPFPGPGLAVRLPGAFSAEALDTLREADAIVREEIEARGLHRGFWQYFGVLLPVRSVGVMGDRRTYSRAAAIRVVTSQDGMTADVPEIPFEVLKKISNRIVNEVPGVNRVVLDLTSKPPSTIEWE